ncbi:arsenate reductase (glutaredoxin) [Neisseria animalis]|uniref:Arsenate reductase n=1 Tax=Neisseria animalis TaxID=492 RepID=A0A5P3MQS8_NEIAN|nr:arsenate reductase (glutaredoxin) [Neisseria animalis]QEY23953.1 arsenate reductase (glutaredoxin) [Neisseria animalis]ROW31649.1 arsenate reductase (glutaredoxin) [Neisseria animalis]VEE05944.1 arsenate reductase [Neisseria animalis]
MPSEFILYHNNRCSKSRAALSLLEERGIQAKVVRYLDTPPDLATLEELFRKLGLESVRDMMRVKDDLYKELALDNPELDNHALLQAIAEHPALLERPILADADRAAIGRPTENLETLLPSS